MKVFDPTVVLAFDRDWTVDISPHPSEPTVPVEWVTYWASQTNHEVWAIGNQELVYDAGIPGVVEAIQRYHGSLDVLGEEDETGYYEWWPSRERRLELLAELFPDADKYVVVDDLDLSHVEGWEHYHAWDFLEALDTELSHFLSSPEDDKPARSIGPSDHEIEMRRRLRNAVQVEVTYEDWSRKTIRSRQWKRPRPSSLPPDHPSVMDFTTEDGEERRVKIRDIVDLTILEAVPESEREPKEDDTPDPVTADYPDINVLLGRARYASVFSPRQRVEFGIDVLRVATEEDVLQKKLADDFADAVEGVPEEGTAIARIAEYITDYPSILVDYVSDLCELMGVTDEAVTRRATWCLMTLADRDYHAVVDAVPTLAIALESDDVQTRQYATYTLSTVAQSYPEEVLPVLDVFLDRLDDEDQNIQTNTLSAVGEIASEYPNTVTDIVDAVAPLLESEIKRVRNNAVGLLGDIAVQNPDAVVKYADDIAARLHDPNIQARINASIALQRAGQADSEAVARQRRHLTAALDDSSPAVRANACVLIGETGVAIDESKLRALKTDDLNQNVRERAAWALSQLN